MDSEAYIALMLRVQNEGAPEDEIVPLLVKLGMDETEAHRAWAMAAGLPSSEWDDVIQPPQRLA